MLRIRCPWCGVRDEIEYRYRGDATRVRPFRTPAVWLIAPISIAGCVYLFFSLSAATMELAPGDVGEVTVEAGRASSVSTELVTTPGMLLGAAELPTVSAARRFATWFAYAM